MNLYLIKNLFLKYLIFFFPITLILGNAVSNAFLLMVSFLYLVECIEKKKILYVETFEFKIFFLFYLYLIFNSLLSSQIETSLLRTIFYIKYFIFVLVYLDFLNKENLILKKIGFIWILVIFLLSLDIIYQSITGFNIFGFSTGNSLRNSGFFFDELVAGSFILALAFISILMIYQNEKNNSYMLIFLIFFMIICFLTGERANTVKYCLLFAFTVIFLLNWKKANFKKNIIIALIAIFITSPIVYIKFDDIKIRFTNKISYSENRNLNILDKYLTSAYGSHTLSAYFVFKDNPLFGAGNKNFRFECKKYIKDIKRIQQKKDSFKNKFPSGCSTHPHQLYNELLSEHGIIGTSLVLFFIFCPIIKKISNDKLSKLNLISVMYIFIVFLPIIPSGSFFSSYSSSLFWINYLFFLIKKNANNIS